MRRVLPLALLFLVWVPAARAWTWPVEGPVVQGFAFDAAHPYAGGQHRGVDVGASAGAPVAAPAAGSVTFAGSVPTSGLAVTIETGDGFAVTLTHLGSLAVARGATVAEGAVIGTVGPTGTAEVEGPYVHLGIRLADDPNGYRDPLSFLPASEPPSEPASEPAQSDPLTAAPPVEPAQDPAPAAPPVDGSGDAASPPADVAPAESPPPIDAAPPADASAVAEPRGDTATTPPVAAPATGPAPPVEPAQPSGSSTDVSTGEVGAPVAESPSGPVSEPVEAPARTDPTSGHAPEAQIDTAVAPARLRPEAATAPAARPAGRSVEPVQHVNRPSDAARAAPAGRPTARPSRATVSSKPAAELRAPTMTARASTTADTRSASLRFEAPPWPGAATAAQRPDRAGASAVFDELVLALAALAVAGVAALLIGRRRRSPRLPDDTAVLVAFPARGNVEGSAGHERRAA